MFYVYHIKGKKWGCTDDLESRLKQQGFTIQDCANVITVGNRKKASDMERELQIEYGYPVDNVPYDVMQSSMKNPVVVAKALKKLREVMSSKEMKQKLSNIRSNVPKSELWKATASKNRKGKVIGPHSEERKQNISKGCIGRVSGNKGKVRNSTYVKCIHCSKEITIQNISRHQNSCKAT